MNPNYERPAFSPQARQRPHALKKRDNKRDDEKLVRAAHAAVDARDGRQCRCCGRRDKLHRHHIVFRSKGGNDTTENLVTICEFCHAMLHARQLWIFGKNADARLTFEIHEAAVVDLFGVRPLPPHVKITTDRRR
jgi:hypothetical protein